MAADLRRLFQELHRVDSFERTAVGRRARSLVSRRAGKYSRHRLARSGQIDVALDATLRAAAARTGRRRPFEIVAADLRRKVREHRSPLAVALVVDNSYSLAAQAMIEQVKGLAFRLLEEPAHRGDKVGLVAFRGGFPEATIALPLTRSRSLAQRRLEQIPVTGQTPLADALRRGLRILRQESFKHPNTVPLLVAITDGVPTVPLRSGGDPVRDTLAQAHELHRARIGCIVVDAALPGSPESIRGHTAAIAAAAHGIRLPLSRLAPETFTTLLEETR